MFRSTKDTPPASSSPYTTSDHISLGVTWVDPRPVVSVPQSNAYSAGLGLFGGSIVVLYEDTTSGTYDLFAAVSDSGTDPWDTSDRVQSLGSQYGPTHLAWDGARIVGVWNRHSSVAADANPWGAYSDDGGLSWSEPEMISASTAFSVLETQVLSTVVGFYGLYADYAGQAIYYSRLLDDAWTADSSPRPAASLHSAASSPRHVFAAEVGNASAVVVHRAPLPEFIAIAEPVDATAFEAGTATVPVGVVVVAGAADHWEWRTDGPFPTSGTGGGTAVISGTTAAVPVTDGSNVVHVALVDVSGTLLTPTVTDSVTIEVGTAVAPPGGVLVTAPNAYASAAGVEVASEGV